MSRLRRRIPLGRAFAAFVSVCGVGCALEGLGAVGQRLGALPVADFAGFAGGVRGAAGIVQAGFFLRSGYCGRGWLGRLDEWPVAVPEYLVSALA